MTHEQTEVLLDLLTDIRIELKRVANSIEDMDERMAATHYEETTSADTV